MKFNIYYGKGLDVEDQEFISSFNSMEEAEKFLFKYINEKHSKSYYIRTTIVSDTHREYDYGSYTMFYSIIGKEIKSNRRCQ